jgi:hypothetical protein
MRTLAGVIIAALVAVSVVAGIGCMGYGIRLLDSERRVVEIESALSRTMDALDTCAIEIDRLERELSVAKSSVTTQSKKEDTKWREKISLKATWYCGNSRHTRGAGGTLTSGQSVALNNSQREAWGLKYGDRVYVKAPAKYKITGWKVVMDTGCRSGILDAYYVNQRAVPGAFRRAGVVRVRMYIPKETQNK